MTTSRRRPRLLPALVLLAFLSVVGALLAGPVLAVDPSPSATPAAASPTADPGPTAPGATPFQPVQQPPCPNPSPSPTPTPLPNGSPAPVAAPNLCPAEPRGADPFSLIAWLFTPIFQALFLGLVLFYRLLGDIGLAIIVVTVLIRLLLVPVFRAQIVSQRRMQALQPEIRAVQQKFKGNRTKVSEETMRLYRERGVNPASGCLPALIQLVLLIPMYSVFSGGLTAPDISPMLRVFGIQVLDVPCQFPGNALQPCINPTVHWLFGLNASRPEIAFTIPFVGFGISILALLSAVLQVIQTRMLTPQNADPAVRSQQRIFLILPLFSIIYGQWLPAGLFIYWIVTTIFSIVQQYLIAGWGGLFPLFGWNPPFARDHSPRFPVPTVEPRVDPRTSNGAPPPPRRSATDRAAGTVRPSRERGRSSKRGRRR